MNCLLPMNQRASLQLGSRTRLKLHLMPQRVPSFYVYRKAAHDLSTVHPLVLLWACPYFIIGKKTMFAIKIIFDFITSEKLLHDQVIAEVCQKISMNKAMLIKGKIETN